MVNSGSIPLMSTMKLIKLNKSLQNQYLKELEMVNEIGNRILKYNHKLDLIEKYNALQIKYDNSKIIYTEKINNMIIRKVSGLWIVEREHSKQIVFSHKNRMTCYEWIFKGINYA